jgi:3-dehydroquinate dehydratase II
LKKTKILIINGPNLNLTGMREQHHYGSRSLAYLHEMIAPLIISFPGLDVTHFFASDEGSIVDKLHEAASNQFNGIVMNPGGFTHTSVAIGDAIRAIAIPVVEVHISHVYAREEFRKHNLIASACVGSISGLGLQGYPLAIRFLLDLCQAQNQNQQ